MSNFDNDVRLLTEAARRGIVRTADGKRVDVLATLNKSRKAKWAVIGGIATSFWGGRSLPTVDLDLVGDRSAIKVLKDTLGRPDSSSPVYVWFGGTTEEVNVLPDTAHKVFAYMARTAHKTPNMRIASRVGTALGKLAALNSAFRIHSGKVSKGPQDMADMLNLLSKASAKERSDFVKAAKTTLQDMPYAEQDAKNAVKHVTTGESVQISVYTLPDRT